MHQQMGIHAQQSIGQLMIVCSSKNKLLEILLMLENLFQNSQKLQLGFKNLVKQNVLANMQGMKNIQNMGAEVEQKTEAS